MQISSLDIAILLAYLGGMIWFGLWMGRSQKSASDFMLGGRDVPWWVILFSVVATETSTVTFLSVPGIAWSSDLTFLQLPLGYVVGRLMVCGLLLPRYFRGEMFTAYEVLAKRFGGSVKAAASLLFIVTRTLGDGLRLYLSAVVFQVVFDVDIAYAVVGLGCATVIYTFVGGIKAVLWTDFVQFIVYMAGAAVAGWILLGKIDGGWSAALEIADAAPGDKLRVFDWSFNWSTPYLFWTGLIGGSVFALGTHGVDQMMVQRYLCARSERDARWALALSGPIVLLQFAFFLCIGIGLFAFYTQNPQTFEKKDYVFATFIVEHLPAGVLGLVLGAVFSAAMSTLSSSLNSASTALVNDVCLPPTKDVEDHVRLRLARLFTLVFGVLQIIVGIGGQYTEDTPIVGMVLHIQGFTTGIILGVFFLGIFTRGVGTRAALGGLLGGLTVVSCVEFGVFDLVWSWLASLAVVLGCAAGGASHLASVVLGCVEFGVFDLAWPWFVSLGAVATFAAGGAVHLVLKLSGRES